MPRDIISEILRSRRFETLIGLNEDLWFEGKQKTAYNLDTPPGRYELAKDVCAFANSEGGFLLIGVTTVPLIEENTDRVAALDLCTRVDFDCSKHGGVIREYVHPRIDGLKVEWVPQDSQPNLGLGVIEIPAQPSERKYFLTARVVEENQSVRQIVFGLSRRSKSTNDPLSVQELYEMMQKGRSPISEKLGRLEEKVDTLIRAQTAPGATTESPSERIDKRIAELFNET